jgi:hypoxanthine phosphoribosyltransferase
MGVTSAPDDGLSLPPGSRVLLRQEQIQARVRALGEAISRDFAGRELHAVCVLRGALVFAADLLRSLALPVTVDFITVESYGKARTSAGTVRLIHDLQDPVTDRDVLLIEDIVDTGRTLVFLTTHLLELRPACLEVCAFLDKPAAREVSVPVPPRYVGFFTPREYVFGYGLDLAGRYRGLPCLAAAPELQR